MPTIIIGGTPRSGKSSLGIRFSQGGWKHLELDLFKYFLKTISDSPSVSNLWKYDSPSIWETTEAPEEILNHYLETAKLMHEGYLSVLNKIDLESDYLIETSYLLPEHLSEIKTRWPNVKAYCTGFKNSADAEICITEGLKSNPNDWIATIGEENIGLVIKTFSLFSDWIKKECVKYEIEYIDFEMPRDIWVENNYIKISVK